MLEVLLAILVGVLTWMVLRGGWRQNTRTLNMTPRGDTIFLGVLSVAFAVYFFGWMAGIALIVSVMVHEYGHVAAYRVAGHADATFRLIPMFGGVAISKTAPKSELHDFYITIMGPGICLILMIAAILLEPIAWEISPHAANFLYSLAIYTGMLNFFNLLPLWPLDGGRIVRILCLTLSRHLAHYITLIMSAALVVIALLSGSMFLLIFALMSAASAWSIPMPGLYHDKLSIGQMLTGLGAYIAMLICFGAGGWVVIWRFIN